MKGNLKMNIRKQCTRKYIGKERSEEKCQFFQTERFHDRLDCFARYIVYVYKILNDDALGKQFS